MTRRERLEQIIWTAVALFVLAYAIMGGYGG